MWPAARVPAPLCLLWLPSRPPPPLCVIHPRLRWFLLLLFQKERRLPHGVDPGCGVQRLRLLCPHRAVTPPLRAAAWSCPVARRVVAVLESELLGVSDSDVPGVLPSLVRWAKLSSCSLAYSISYEASGPPCPWPTSKRTAEPLLNLCPPASFSDFFISPFYSSTLCYSPGERGSGSTGSHERTRGRGRGELRHPGAHGLRGTTEEEAGETEEAPESKWEDMHTSCLCCTPRGHVVFLCNMQLLVLLCETTAAICVL